MPCGNPNHEHPVWPQQGQHELLIEACENHCGWCEYKTKSANNLRVHAKRHVANKRETRLRRITVFKGKAGRKRVQMTRPRFPAPPEAHEEKQVRSEAADRLGDSIQGHESESNNNTEHETRDSSFPSRSDYPRQDFLNQIPSVTPARSASSDQRSDEANHPEPNLPWYGSERLNSNSKILFLPAYTQEIQASKRSIEQNPGYEVTSTTNKIVAWPRRASVESENRARETCQPDEQDTYETYHEASHVCPNSSGRSRPTEYPDNHRSMDINQVSHQYLPSTAAQVRSTELQNSGSMPPGQSSLQTVEYSRREQGSPNRSGSFSPFRLTSNESQDTNKQQSHNERRVEPRFTSMMRSAINEDILEKPHLEEFKALAQQIFDWFAAFGSDAAYNLKLLGTLEIKCTTTALEIAKSDISYLSFTNALLRCIRKIYEFRLFGSFHSDRYFAESLARIHEDAGHMSEKSPYLSPEKVYWCNHNNCWGNGLNLPKRYFKVHLQYYHNEDVGFTEDKDIMGCTISYSYWYCSGCLGKIFIPTKWVCLLCGLACEQNRIKARQKLIPTGWTVDAGMDNNLPSPLDRTSPLERTTTMTDSSVLKASDTTQQLLRAASTLPTVIAGTSRP